MMHSHEMIYQYCNIRSHTNMVEPAWAIWVMRGIPNVLNAVPCMSK